MTFIWDFYIQRVYYISILHENTMQFIVKVFSSIKWKVDQLIEDHKVHTLNSSQDLLDILSGEITSYNTYHKDKCIWKMIITYWSEHIWTCKYIIDHKDKSYTVTRIWIRENLQRSWIWTSFYEKVLIPFMSEEVPWYEIKKAHKQLPWWEWIHRKLDS